MSVMTRGPFDAPFSLTQSFLDSTTPLSPSNRPRTTRTFTDMAPQKEAEQPLLGSAEEKRKEEVRGVKTW